MRFPFFFSGGITPGIVRAVKALIPDSNKDLATLRYVRATRQIEQRGAHTSLATVGAGTYLAAALLSGKIVRDPSGAGRTDTFDSAANIVAALPGAAVGDEIRCLILNDADAAETITLGVPASGAFATTNKTHTIAQNGMAEVIIRLTNVGSGTEAYVVYG